MLYSIISLILGILLVVLNKAAMTPVCLGGLPCLLGIAFIWAGIMNTFFWKYGYSKPVNK